MVGATHTLPRAILDRLEPWDLPNLVPYNESYLSGFQSEIYQVDLDEGFEQARGIMDSRIYNAIISDIGGDQQRVHSLQTQHCCYNIQACLTAGLVGCIPLQRRNVPICDQRAQW